jgi:hypothetical protein
VRRQAATEICALERRGAERRQPRHRDLRHARAARRQPSGTQSEWPRRSAPDCPCAALAHQPHPLSPVCSATPSCRPSHSRQHASRPQRRAKKAARRCLALARTHRPIRNCAGAASFASLAPLRRRAASRRAPRRSARVAAVSLSRPRGNLARGVQQRHRCRNAQKHTLRGLLWVRSACWLAPLKEMRRTGVTRPRSHALLLVLPSLACRYMAPLHGPCAPRVSPPHQPQVWPQTLGRSARTVRAPAPQQCSSWRRDQAQQCRAPRRDQAQTAKAALQSVSPAAVRDRA